MRKSTSELFENQKADITKNEGGKKLKKIKKKDHQRRGSGDLTLKVQLIIGSGLIGIRRWASPATGHDEENIR